MLKSDKTQFNTEEEKGEHLAHLLRQRRCLLVLDGLEPLQHAGKGMRGELKDRAIRQLLKSLAGEHNSLCIITTRIAVHELSDRNHAISHNLQNLTPQDGVSLLKSLQVCGNQIELEKAVQEYGCHALALHLLGNALLTYLGGDVRKRDTLSELIDDYDDVGRHAFKVMQAYTHWLAGTPDLQLLHLLGLFDHPIEIEVLQILWQAQVPSLTAGIPEKAWKVAIRDLREKHRMLSVHEGRPELLDCHPLIREFFGKQLQTKYPKAWKQAHERLYDYYKELPEKELPDSLEGMQPLFDAVTHGCAAGLHHQALEEVYWPRIQREGENYLCSKLGEFSVDLATVAHFFTTPWQIPASGLRDEEKVGVLNWAGFRLRALGRINEAEGPMQANSDYDVKYERWLHAALSTGNLSELQLTSGDIAKAVGNAAQSVAYADKSGELFQRTVNRTTHAHILYQAGKIELARELFQAAEALQQEDLPEYPYLYSLQGFQYCDLLLELGEKDAVFIRAEKTMEWAIEGGLGLLSIALDQLSLGRAYLQKAIEENSSNLPLPGNKQMQPTIWLEKAVASLRAAGHEWLLPLGILTRAILYRHTHDFSRARQDLEEVFDIVEPSEMRLFLTDYHLEMARLILEESKTLTPNIDTQQVPPIASPASESTLTLQDHINQAQALITATGYHRRDAELADLISKASESTI